MARTTPARTTPARTLTPSRTTARTTAATIVASALALGSVVATTPAQAAPTAASTRTTHAFSCTGILGRVYTRQTVTGTLGGVSGARPSDVSTINYTGAVLVTTPKPTLVPTWWSGVFTAQGSNQWALGKDTSGNSYHLMLPTSTPGASFVAELVSEFGPGGMWGNWQNHMTCTSS